MKKLLQVSVFLSTLFLLTPLAFAECQVCAAGHSMKSGSHDGMSSRDSGKDGCPIAGKVLMKAHFFTSNSDEIGLSQDQVAQIKAIKMQTKKRMIQDGANMQLFMIDVESKLMEEKVDVEGLNALIDQGTTGMTASAKESVKAYADIKAVLTPDQMKKAKEIWLGKKKEH